MAITTVDLEQEIIARKHTSGLSYKALILLGLDSISSQQQNNSRLKELEEQVEKLNIARSKMQDRILELTESQSPNDGAQ